MWQNNRTYKNIYTRPSYRILIGHNIAYDLMWLWECGFKYDGPVFDTMLAEYILQRGIKNLYHLEACAERYDLDTKKARYTEKILC